MKITRTRGAVVRDSTFVSNTGPGIVVRRACYDVTAVGDSFLANAGNGMSFEISSTGIFAKKQHRER